MKKRALKKLISAGLVSAMVLSMLAGCGSDSDTQSASESGVAENGLLR